jgi:hypothetical protein
MVSKNWSCQQAFLAPAPSTTCPHNAASFLLPESSSSLAIMASRASLNRDKNRGEPTQSTGNKEHLICWWCRTEAEFFRPPLARRCRGCQTKHIYHTTCRVEGCFTQFCTKPDHPVCWYDHVASLPPHIKAEHVETNPIYGLFVDSVMHAEADDIKLQALHSRDRLARWFSVNKVKVNVHGPAGQTKEEPELWLYDRFSRLCDPRRTGHCQSENVYPTFVSFIGRTTVGKSTIVRGLLLLGLLSGEAESSDESKARVIKEVKDGLGEMPLPKSANKDDKTMPTTFGVHLYRDNAPLSPKPLALRRTTGFVSKEARKRPSEFPLLFADCEGFEAGEASTAAQKRTEIDEEDEEGTAGLLKLPMTAQCYGQEGKSGIDMFYARVLYALSDVVVYVFNGDNIMFHLQRILEWACAAVEKSYNIPSRKTLIIVRNMERDWFQNGAPGLDDFETHYLHSMDEVLWVGSKSLELFVEEHNKRVRHEDRIEDNEQLYRALFNKVRCCYIPDGGESTASPERAELVYEHLKTLRALIENSAEEEQKLRSRAFAQYNAPALEQILGQVFDHFRQFETPLDFYSVTRGDNPTPMETEEHIANFLRLALEEDREGTSATQDAIVSAVSAAFVLHVRRNANQREC